MNKDKAIKYLNEFILFKKISNITEEEAVECFKLAVEALQQQPSEDEQIIKVRKGTLKARTGRYVIYDVEWLKTHFNTTEAKIYGQPQPKERTETHACDCISREALDNAISGLTYWHFENGRLIPGGGGIKTETVYKVDDVWRLTHILPSVAPQPKTEDVRDEKVGHWIMPQQDDGMSDPIYYQVRCSECNFDLDPQTWGQELNQYGADKYCPNCGCRMQEVQQ